MFQLGVALCYLAIPAPVVSLIMLWDSPLVTCILAMMAAPVVLFTAGFGLMALDAV